MRVIWPDGHDGFVPAHEAMKFIAAGCARPHPIQSAYLRETAKMQITERR